MEKRYSDILEKWFILEPPLFQVLCLHDLKAETQMACPLRSGRKRIEYNPDIVNEMSDEALEEALRAEALRILLKHPYERRPEGCSQRAMGLGSNLVIGDNYAHQRFKIETPKEYGLKGGMNYEWYARQVEEQQEGSGKGKSDEGEGPGNDKAEYGGGDNDGDEKGSGEKYRDLAELWEEGGAQWSRHRVTLDDAIAAGLRVDKAALREGVADEDIWRQEYFCEFLANDTTYFPLDLIRACERIPAPEAPPDAPRSTLRFALQLQKKCETMFPGLMRPVLFSQRKYNMDMTRFSLLIEMGSETNTLEEACYSGRMLAAALASLMDEYTE